jgi:hypothetical protein
VPVPGRTANGLAASGRTVAYLNRPRPLLIHFEMPVDVDVNTDLQVVHK